MEKVKSLMFLLKLLPTSPGLSTHSFPQVFKQSGTLTISTGQPSGSLTSYLTLRFWHSWFSQCFPAKGQWRKWLNNQNWLDLLDGGVTVQTKKLWLGRDSEEPWIFKGNLFGAMLNTREKAFVYFYLNSHHKSNYCKSHLNIVLRNRKLYLYQ